MKPIALLIAIVINVCHSFPHNVLHRPMENPQLLDGDILIDKQNRFAVTRKERLWPDGTIPFVYDDNLPEVIKKVINQSMEYISSNTCIKFTPRTNHVNYVRFINGDGCSSYVGRTGHRDGQPVSMGYGCDTLGIATHEIMHAIGFEHHHNRPDRDEYIQIHWENADEKYHKTIFFKLSYEEAQVFTPFDFDSLMMYTSNAFAKTPYLKTITSKVPGKIVTNKDKTKMTASDIYSINKLYGCV